MCMLTSNLPPLQKTVYGISRYRAIDELLPPNPTPTLFWRFTLAPRLSKNSTTSQCPLSAAWCRAVLSTCTQEPRANKRVDDITARRVDSLLLFGTRIVCTRISIVTSFYQLLLLAQALRMSITHQKSSLPF